jgi:hypothetical protein
MASIHNEILIEAAPEQASAAVRDISALLGIDPRVLLAVEVPGLPKKATLLTYLRYAEFLVVCRDLDRLKTEKLVA